ncbi:hypothetical protein Ahy_A04g020031 [Arachis hypogaea]|uniref:PHD-type domain-containing protein n=1 Tax=Arachis hypogaea TaxID=3818 RepID=A0A445DGY0_ARAHY|nr:hypothetical protein Ahy_A04g020031 [Arachis hypogaea]
MVKHWVQQGLHLPSVEKLKTEKELQRAKSEILRRKLKIRDLFWNLGLLCAEGKLLESLFDSEGAIRSDDIFGAKYGSKELTTDNDIILCDSACDRGFHQCCLRPPLLTKDRYGWYKDGDHGRGCGRGRKGTPRHFTGHPLDLHADPYTLIGSSSGTTVPTSGRPPPIATITPSR